MEHKEFPYLYMNSAAEAKRYDELDRWRESYKVNVACKKAIEEAIRQDFDGMHLKEGCVQRVISEYGFKRMEWVPGQYGTAEAGGQPISARHPKMGGFLFHSRGGS